MSTIDLLPSSTVANSGVVVTGASAHAALADSSDASYIGDIDSGDTITLGFDDFTLPAGAVITNAIGYYRIATTTGPAATYQINSSLPDSTSGTWPLPGAAVNLSPADGAFALIDQPSDAQLDASTITLFADGGNFQPDALRVYKLWLRVLYVTQPVVSADTPTGTLTTTNLPTIGWSWTPDSDGGAQTRYEVKVFTDAQYGAGGFDPDSSTSTVSSGIKVGADTTWQLTQTLADDTYRAYVRVAQTVNGSLLWSAWDPVEFTIDVDVPGTPTLVATADNANARVGLTVTDVPGVVSTDWFELNRSTDGGTTWGPVRTLDGTGTITLPWVAAVGEFASAADATSHALVLPAPFGGIRADDMLIAVVAMDGNPTMTWPAGWAEIKDEAGNGSAVRVAVAWKRATGGESGTITLTTSASEGGGARILCVRGASTATAPEVSTGVSSSAANANPDSLNPAGWGTEPTLWIAAMGLDGNVAITAGPSGYYEFGNTRWANASGASVATAALMSLAASADPGTFTHTLEDSRAFTIGVRPKNAAATVYDYEGGNGDTVSYRARAVHDYDGGSAASAWSATDSESWTGASWWLKHPERPDLNQAVLIRSFASRARAGRQGVFQALGASYPIVVSDTRSSQTGQITLRSDSDTEQAELDALLDTVGTLLIQPPTGQGTDLYLRVTNHDRQRVVDAAVLLGRVFEVLDFVEVAAPTGDVVAWP